MEPGSADWRAIDPNIDLNQWPDAVPFVPNRVGTTPGSPWKTTWNTHWMPDQVAGGVKFLASIGDNNGIWFVTEEVGNLGQVRTGISVRLYKPTNVLESYWMRTPSK